MPPWPTPWPSASPATPSTGRWPATWRAANGLGEIGSGAGAEPGLTVGADPHGAAALLELHDATGHPAFYEGALAAGERILGERFHRGFFTLDEIPA